MVLMPLADDNTSGDLPIAPDIEPIPAYSLLHAPAMETEAHSPSLDDSSRHDNG